MMLVEICRVGIASDDRPLCRSRRGHPGFERFGSPWLRPPLRMLAIGDRLLPPGAVSRAFRLRNHGIASFVAPGPYTTGSPHYSPKTRQRLPERHLLAFEPERLDN